MGELVLLIPVGLFVAFLVLCATRRRAAAGATLAVAGFHWAHLWRQDPGEGPFLTPIGVMAGLAGVVMLYHYAHAYCEGLKKDIIEAIERTAAKDKEGR